MCTKLTKHTKQKPFRPAMLSAARGLHSPLTASDPVGRPAPTLYRSSRLEDAEARGAAQPIRRARLSLPGC